MVRLITLGSFDLRRADDRVVGSVLHQPKRAAVLTYLALARGFVRRDLVLGLFWPDHDAERARNSLNQCSFFLRRSLGPEIVQNRAREEIGIGDGQLWCDAVAFEELLDAGKPAEALEHYGGEFLPGFYLEGVAEFERWLDRERRRLGRRAGEAAWELAGAARAAGDVQDALRWAERATEIQPYDEAVLRRLLELYADTGNRARALRAYERYAARVGEHLETEPSEPTRALIARIRSGARTAEPDAYPGIARTDARVADDADPARSAGDSADDATGRPSADHDGRPDESTAAPTTGIGPSAAGERPGDGSGADSSRGRTAEGVDRAERRRTLVSLRGAVVLGAIALILVPLWLASRDADEPRPPAAVLDDPARIAVLPFEHLSAADSMPSLADALTNALIDQLADIPALDVVSRNGRAGAADEIEPAREGERLGATLVITGGVLESAGRLRVNVQLTDATSGATRSSFTVERPVGELFALLDDLSREVAAALRVRLGREIRLQRWRAGTEHAGAWRRVQQAQWYRDRAEQLRNSALTPSAASALRTADSLLAAAEAIDPNWSEPLLLRAQVARRLGWLHWRPGSSDYAQQRQLWELGIEHANRLIAREPDRSEAYELRGSLKYLIWWLGGGQEDVRSGAEQLISAEDDLTRATTLDPTNAAAWSTLSAILSLRAQFDEAHFAARQAYLTDAFLSDADEILGRLVETSLEIADDSAAHRWCDEIRERYAANWGYARCSLLIDAWQAELSREHASGVWGRVNSAEIPSYARPIAQPQLELLAATVLARAGLTDSATAVVNRIGSGASNPELMRLEAMAQMALGNSDSAAHLLYEYIAARLPSRARFLYSRVFEPISDHPSLNELYELGRESELELTAEPSGALPP